MSAPIFAVGNYIAYTAFNHATNPGKISYGKILRCHMSGPKSTYTIQWFYDDTCTKKHCLTSDYYVDTVDANAVLHRPLPTPLVPATPRPAFKIGDYIVKRGLVNPIKYTVLDLLMSPSPNSQHAGYRIRNQHHSFTRDISLSEASHWKLSANQNPGHIPMTKIASTMSSPASFGGFKQMARKAPEYKVVEFDLDLAKSSCDCGGHKCGYKDNELHGHATWCKLNDKFPKCPILTHEEKQ